MTARPLNAVLRALADTGPPDADADLLRRFVATRDDEAFATLVKRHGRLVWAVCRHLCRSDAEADDAFQATFLVLVRNAAGVKDAAKLSAWLHGVAYKVCGKSRLAAKRRATREQAAAGRERNGHAIPDSAWDRALAAVHEEVAGLPDTLRVPFVLCCLEGKGQTEAAEQLGWKLGTLSGRLTRAKDAVLAKLSARGLTLGVLASVGLATVPADVSAKAVGLGQIGFAVPGSVLQLSTGVIGMSVNKVKLLAAGVLAACGLAVSGGAGWVATAEGQTSALPAKAAPADRVKQLEAELQRARADAEVARMEAELAARKALEAKAKADADLARFVIDEVKAAKAPKVADDANRDLGTVRWQYKFVTKPAGYAPTLEQFNAVLNSTEAAGGWDFVSQITTTTREGELPTLVFRRPWPKLTTTPSGTTYTTTADPKYVPAYPAVPAPPAPPLPPLATAPAQSKPALDDADAIEAEIKRLQEKLEVLKKSKPKAK